MADITMCEGTTCTERDKCYRFTAKACEYRQSYFVGVPVVVDYTGRQRCEEFWPNTFQHEQGE